MALINTWFFTKTVIDWGAIEAATHNQYKVVSVRPYQDKKGKLPDGITMTLMVIKDTYDYGNSKDGKSRENNLYQNFEATVLNRNHAPKKGDTIKLIGFDSENSFAINFDLILRFADMEIIQTHGAKSNA